MKTFPKFPHLLVGLVVFFIIIVISRELRLVVNKPQDSFTNYQQKYHVTLPNFHIGNKLSSYFYFLTIAYITNENLVIDNLDKPENDIIKLQIPQESSIPDDCPIFLTTKLETIKSIAPESFWSHHQYFKYIYPVIKKNSLYNPNIQYIKECVIHFRCSDVPFVKHGRYHLLKFNWYLNCLRLVLREMNLSKITILNCNAHLSKDTNKCQEWTNLLGRFLKDNLNIEYEVLCHSLKEDLLYMLNARALISSGGSLSFSAGLLSNNLFIYPSSSLENETINCHKHQIRQNSYCLNKVFIRHSEVDDYHHLDNKLFY